LFAHPHSFIDYETTICFDDEGVSGVQTTWYFDEMFSSFVEAYDVDGDRIFSDAEVKVLKAEAFDNLKEHNYFSKFYIDGKIFYPTFIKDFKPFFVEDKIVYSFFVPCHVQATAMPKEMIVMFFDPTYYIHVDPVKKEAVSFENDHNYSVVVNREKRKQDAYYQNVIVPAGFRVRFSKK
ncbi:MAG: DUF1007 family protein, partial [Candidatus Margulisbacteria bacterium]|nr:DUF1007 family protein [Candidatus Margulisiibacteriota bacterium]